MRKEAIEGPLLIISHVVLIVSLALNVIQYRSSQKIAQVPMNPTIEDHYVYMRGGTFYKFISVLNRKLDFNLFPSPSFVSSPEFEELSSWIQENHDKDLINNYLLKFAVIRNSGTVPVKDLRIIYDKGQSHSGSYSLDGKHSLLMYLGKRSTSSLGIVGEGSYQTPEKYQFTYDVLGRNVDVNRTFHVESGKALSFEIGLGPIDRAFINIDDPFFDRNIYESRENSP